MKITHNSLFFISSGLPLLNLLADPVGKLLSQAPCGQSVTALMGASRSFYVERAGATIAELPVFDDKPYPSTVIAEEEAVVLFLDKRDVRKLCLEHPQIALCALRLLAGRLRKCAELVETLSLREVDQRLARWLLSEAKSHGTRSNGPLEITLRLTHQQIASRIGSVREVVSRALGRLQQNGLIKVEGCSITITDEKALTSYAEE